MIINLDKYQDIIEYSKKCFDCSAHDFSHTQRVLYNAMAISKSLQVKMDILIPAILLHDIARAETDKLGDKSICHAVLGGQMARKFLKDIEYEASYIEAIVNCIESHNFRNKHLPNSLEAKILFDADKIDGIGAIGIARLFSMSGKYNTPLYGHKSDSDKYVAPNVEFSRKHDHLLERFHFETSKTIALKRINFMKSYFKQMDEEINQVVI